MQKGDIVLEEKNLEVLAYIKGAEDCKRCYGKGYTGVTLAGNVLTCRCAVVREPMTAKIIKSQAEIESHIREIHANIDVSFGDILKRINDLESRFIRTKILRLFGIK